MMVNTIIKDTNIYGGKFDSNRVPQNRIVVESNYIDGFIYPLWNGKDFYEGASQQEIDLENQRKVEVKTIKIYEEYEKLLTSSLARAVSKVGQGLTRDQLNNLREEYGDIKKLADAYLADGTILNAKAFQDINDEMELDFPEESLYAAVYYLNLKLLNCFS